MNKLNSFNKLANIAGKRLLLEKKKYPSWHKTQNFPPNRLFAILTICKWSLDCIASQGIWGNRAITLMDEFQDVANEYMGFPDDWRNNPIWDPNC